MIHHRYSSTQVAVLEDMSFNKEELNTNFLLGINVVDNLKNFGKYEMGCNKPMPEESQQKSIQCNMYDGVWLSRYLASSRRAEPENGTNFGGVEKNETKWIGLHDVISDDSNQQKSLQRFSAYSVWLQNIIAPSRRRSADSGDSRFTVQEVEESDTKWIDPVDIIAHKITKQVGVVSRACKSIRAFNAGLNVYKSFLRPMVELSLPVTSPYKITDLVHNAANAQNEILKSTFDKDLEPKEFTEYDDKLPTGFVLFYKMINGFANSSGVMNRITSAPSLRPLIFHNHLFSHSNRGTKYPEEALALFILLKMTPHQYTSFQRHCCYQGTNSVDS